MSSNERRAFEFLQSFFQKILAIVNGAATIIIVEESATIDIWNNLRMKKYCRDSNIFHFPYR